MEYRVFGSPGTGKTTYISGQIRRAVETRGPDAVLVASFTKAAAVELAGRDLPLPDRSIGTLHALCYRQLGTPTIAETKLPEFNKHQTLYSLSAGSVDVDEPDQQFETDGDRLMARMQVYRSRMVDFDKWPLDVQAFAHRWNGWKYQTGYIDFTDMIELAVERKIPPPGYPEIAFFDEVQDFTQLELTLIRQWAEYLEYIVLAGDDDQCIYGFKGASPDAFLYPDLPGEQKRVLGQSWRLPTSVHSFSQNWIHQVAHREPKEFLPRDATGNLWHRPELRLTSAAHVINEAQAMAKSGQSVMLLASCSYQVNYLIRELRKRGELFHNPYRRKRGDWNPFQANPRKGVTSTRDRLLAFSRPSRAAHGDAARGWTYGEFRQFTGLLKRTGVIKRGMYAVVERGIEDEPVAMDTLQTIVEDGALMPMLKNDLLWLSRNAATDKAKSLEYPLAVVQQNGWGKLFEQPRIVVGTIHSVKGGEADTVMLFPDLSRAGYAEYLDRSTRDNVTRQMYVGMTRTKENLILCGKSTINAVNW